MKSIKVLLSAMVMLSVASVSYGASYRCVGMDGEGTQIHVIYDEDTSTVNVNGNILKIESGTQGNNGVATEDFENTDGKKVYVSLVVEDKDKIILRQYDAKNDEELVVVPLACK